MIQLRPVVSLMVFAAVFLFVSCSQSSGAASSSKKTELFTLEYGSFEDEINLLNLTGADSVNTHIVMRDGFFYISNGAQKKIMQLNSYGDLLSLYYNPETNPAPEFASDSGHDIRTIGDERRELATQMAVAYPFENPGALAVDSQKNIYVVDTLPSERVERDTENNLRLSQVVLRFSESGAFVDYLGQRGPGGIPFPWIQNIYTTKHNELVVVCRTNSGMNVYWFSPTGFLLYMIPIQKAALPNPVTDIEDVFMSLEQIVPDPSLRRLYLKIDYFANAIDAASKVQSGIDYKGTYIYPMDIAANSTTGRFLDPIGVPPFEQIEEKNFSKTSYMIAYDFLGQTDSGWFFFSIPDDTGYTIQMIQPNEQTVLKRHLDVDTAHLLYYAFALSDKGILSALLADEKKVTIAWWRTDTVIDSLLKK
jgi:hypothetical protein